MARKKATATTPLEQHEEICALRFKQIEERLDSRSARFVRLEQMVWGLYALIISLQIVGALI